MGAHAPPAALRPSGGTARVGRALLFAAVVALYARTFVAAAAVVPTASMAPALEPGDRVLVNRLLYARDLPAALGALLPVREPRVGDVVWARSPIAPGVALVKRVAATAGDSFQGVRLPDGQLALLGDRSADSLDSRSFGAVARASVSGRVCLVLWSSAVGEGVRRGRTLRPVR